MTLNVDNLADRSSKVRLSGSTKSHAAKGGFSITPTDGVDLERITRAIYIGGTGNLSYVDVYGNTVTLPAISVGEHPIQAVQVRATGTTATNIRGLY